MKTELIEISPTQKELKIEIEADAVKVVFDKVSKKYANQAQVPGFRKGLAPVDVVRVRFKEEIKSDVLQELIAPKVTEAIQEHDLSPLAEPQLHLEDAGNLKLNGTEPISLRVFVEVMPEIADPTYKGLKVTKRVKPIGDQEVDNIIDERRQQQANLIPIEDRPAQDGDTVIVDLEGTFVDEPDSVPITANDLEVTLGDELIEQSFTENLVGVKEDEEKEFSVTYAADFSSPALAGKTVNYKAKVKSVGTVELPELDDEWVKSLDEGFESVEELRTKLREDLEAYAEVDADNHVRNELIAKLIEENKFEVPNAMIDIQARNLLNNFGQDLAQRGVDLQKVEKEFIETAYNQMRIQAERDVCGAMLLEKIAELENAEVSSEAIAEEIERMAEYYNTTPEEIRASLSQQQGGEENIANSLRTRQAVEALVEHAEISVGEWVDDTHSRAEADEADEVAKSKKAEETETEETESKGKDSKKKTKKKSAEKEG
jgi:trigger factor